MQKNRIKLENAEIIFANLEDKGFGTSLTIKVTDEIEKQLTDFWKENKIGNDKTVIGVPNFKEYEGTKQISLKINDSTKSAGVNGARFNLFLNFFEYNNKFTKGKTYYGASVSAYVVLSGKKTGSDADLSDLLSEIKPDFLADDEKSDLPF